MLTSRVVCGSLSFSRYVGIRSRIGWQFLEMMPHNVTITTRIITCLVGDPYKPSCSFSNVTGRGSIPNNLFCYFPNKNRSSLELNHLPPKTNLPDIMNTNTSNYIYIPNTKLPDIMILILAIILIYQS